VASLSFLIKQTALDLFDTWRTGSDADRAAVLNALRIGKAPDASTTTRHVCSLARKLIDDYQGARR
jgi:hypothetical protein